jgi:anti-sigma regulatory factor (Ser/Thr protein kinase)
MAKSVSFRMKATLENVPRAMACVRASARAAGFDEQALYQIELAVDEACANVVEHAYEGVEPGDVEVCCSLDNQDFVVRIRDWGKTFNPDEVPEPDVHAPLEERTLGGLGLFLMRQFMDRIQFTFDPEGGNTLVMVKKRQSAE